MTRTLGKKIVVGSDSALWGQARNFGRLDIFLRNAFRRIGSICCVPTELSVLLTFIILYVSVFFFCFSGGICGGLDWDNLYPYTPKDPLHSKASESDVCCGSILEPKASTCDCNVDIPTSSHWASGGESRKAAFWPLGGWAGFSAEISQLQVSV